MQRLGKCDSGYVRVALEQLCPQRWVFPVFAALVELS